MNELLLAAGVARELIPQLSILITTIFAERRDPTPEEIKALKDRQSLEEDEFNADLPN